MDTQKLIQQMRASIEADLQTSLSPLLSESAHAIADMISYHLGWNQPGGEGKRIRPVFTLLCCAAAGGEWKPALPAATAIEWIHNFSLIHDDIQDQSTKRRGRETLWVREGIAQAINTGDAIFALARIDPQRLVERGVTATTALRVMEQLDHACLKLTVGQHLDLEFEGRSMVGVAEYLKMISGKTGALLEAACRVGALIGDPEADAQDYGEFGCNVGLAFQMYDDLLGIWGDSELTGKPAGDDIALRKKTFPILFGMETSPRVNELWATSLDNESQIQRMIEALEDAGARDHVLQRAESYTQQALSALDKAQPLQPFGQLLQDFALDLVRRVS